MKDTLSLTYFEDGTLTSDIEKVNTARQLVQDANAKAVKSAKLIIAAHGADAFRLYEMFLGPLEAVKPWSTRSIEGVDDLLGGAVYIESYLADVKTLLPPPPGMRDRTQYRLIAQSAGGALGWQINRQAGDVVDVEPLWSP